MLDLFHLWVPLYPNLDLKRASERGAGCNSPFRGFWEQLRQSPEEAFLQLCPHGRAQHSAMLNSERFCSLGTSWHCQVEKQGPVNSSPVSGQGGSKADPSMRGGQALLLPSGPLMLWRACVAEQGQRLADLTKAVHRGNTRTIGKPLPPRYLKAGTQPSLKGQAHHPLWNYLNEDG